MDSQTGTIYRVLTNKWTLRQGLYIECSLFPYFMNNHILYHTHKDSQMDSQTGTIYRVLTISLFYEQSHIIAHSQGLTNGLSDRDYRVLTISLFYVKKIN